MTPTIDHINAYLQSLTGKGQAETTLETRRSDLTQLLQRGVDLDTDQVIAFVTFRSDGSRYSKNTRNRRLLSVRGFVYDLLEQGELQCDPTIGLKLVAIPESSKMALTIAELRQVAQVLADQPHDWRRTRDEAVLALLYNTGLRVNELRELNLDQVDSRNRLLCNVRRKGGGIVDVVLNPEAAGALFAWLLERPTSRSPALFIGGHARERLTVRFFQKRLRRLGQQAGLLRPLTPHVLRHTHATELMHQGVVTPIISRSMNHRSVKTTEIYLYRDLTMVRRATGLMRPILSRGVHQLHPTMEASLDNKKALHP